MARQPWKPPEVVWVSVDCEDCPTATREEHEAMGSKDYFRRETYLTVFTTKNRDMDDLFDRPGTTAKYRSRVILSPKGESTEVHTMRVSDFLTQINQEIRRRGKEMRLIGHNVLYDLVCMFRDQLARYTDTLALTSRLIRGRIFDEYRDPKQPISVWDSFNWSTGSLKSIGKTIGYPKFEGELVTMGRPLSTQERESLVPYCCRDTEIVLEYGEKLGGEFQEMFGTELGPTIAGTAAKIIHKHLEAHHEDSWVPFNEPEALQAYFGGRVECFQMGDVEGCLGAWDINSSYPNAMCEEYPHTASLQHYRNGHPALKGMKTFQKLKHGIALVTIHIPHNPKRKSRLVPPLPFKGKDGAVHFPTGTITGWYCVPEIRNAVAWGARIVTLHEAWLTDKGVHYFEPVIRPAYEQRRLVKKTAPIKAETLKLLMNSGYGKFAEQKPRTSVVGLVRGAEAVMHDEGNPQATVLATWEGLTSIRFPLIEAPETASYLIGSYVTAYARINLHKALQAIASHPDMTLMYCDTDSAYVWKHDPNAVPDIEIDGGKLGAWKEESAAYFRTFGPKNYVCLAKNEDGPGYHWTFKTKGWKPNPKDVDFWCPDNVGESPEEIRAAIDTFQSDLNPIWKYLCLCEAVVCKTAPTKLVSSIRRQVRPGEWYDGPEAPKKRLKPESRYTRRREVDGGLTHPKRAPANWALKPEERK